MEFIDILKAAVEKGASDVHILIGKPPMVRFRGEILPLVEFPEISAEEAKRLIYSILYDDQKQKFEEHLELDCSFEIKNLSRFRVNVLMLLLLPAIVVGFGCLLSLFLSQILSITIAAVAGVGLIFGASYLSAYLEVFRQTVWTITYLELSALKELDVIEEK